MLNKITLVLSIVLAIIALFVPLLSEWLGEEIRWFEMATAARYQITLATLVPVCIALISRSRTVQLNQQQPRCQNERYQCWCEKINPNAAS